MTPIHHPRMSHPFQGEGDPLRTQGEGSHPFQEGWGAVMSHPKRGGGTVMSHPKGACPKSSERGVSQGRLHQSQPRGGVGGSNYVNVGTKCLPFYSPHEDFFKLLVFPKLILLIL